MRVHGKIRDIPNLWPLVRWGIKHNLELLGPGYVAKISKGKCVGLTVVMVYYLFDSNRKGKEKEGIGIVSLEAF